MFVLKGEGKVTISDGTSREFGPGSVFLFEDISGKGHRSKFFEECVIAVARI